MTGDCIVLCVSLLEKVLKVIMVFFFPASEKCAIILRDYFDVVHRLYNESIMRKSILTL